MSLSVATWEDNIELFKRTPDKFYKLAVVDPQYGLNATKMSLGNFPARSSKGQYPGESSAVKIRRGRLTSGGGQHKTKWFANQEVDWDDAPPPPEYFSELFRVSVNQVIFGGNYFPLPPTRGIIAWDKMQSLESFSAFELIWTSFDFPAKIIRVSNTGGRNDQAKIVVSQKPILLYKKLFKIVAAPGDNIIDTHLGSGSARIAAHEMGLDFTACERSKETFRLQERRFKSYLSAPKLNLQAAKVPTTGDIFNGG